MSSLLVIASLIGNIAFAFSGFLVGVRHRLDWMGVFIVSFNRQRRWHYPRPADRQNTSGVAE